MIISYNGGKKLTLTVENPADRLYIVFSIRATISPKGTAYVPISNYQRILTEHKGKITVDEKTKDAIQRSITQEREQVLKQQRERISLELQRKKVTQEHKMERDAIKQKQQRILDSEKPLLSRASEIKMRVVKDPRNYASNNEYSPFLMPHQKAGCDLAELFKKYAFFYDTGTGKTVMALEIMSRVSKQSGGKFLIVCPKTIINTAWMSDCARFYPLFKLLPLSKNISIEQYKAIYTDWNKIDSNYERLYYDDWTDGKKEDRLAFVRGVLAKRADAYIINPESFDVKYYLKLGITGLLVDESSMLKNYSSVITRKVREVAEKMEYLYFLSGKPAPNNFSEYFSQMKIIDGVFLDMSYDYYVRVINTSRNTAALVDRKSMTLSKTDCLDLPPKAYSLRKVTLDRQARTKYNEMLRAWRFEYLKELNQRKNIEVGNHLSALSKLRQIASGFIIESNDKNREYVPIHSHKIEELKTIIDELGDSQAIIWCEFQHEIEEIEKLLLNQKMTVVTAYGKTKDKDLSIRKFKEGTARFIVAHPRTLMYGVTLTNCTYAIYYSTSYSYEAYYQSHDRIYRMGQSNPCTYIFIQSESTIDEVMYDCLQNKRRASEFFENLLKSIDRAK